jgi:LPS sulfotransferase NodH
VTAREGIVIRSGHSAGLAPAFRDPLRRGAARTIAFDQSPGGDALARTVLKLRSLWGRSDYSKFVIVGIARTGSTLLIDLLAAHGQAIAFGELFRTEAAIGWDVRPFASDTDKRKLALYRSDPVEFLRTDVFRRWPSDIDAVGFKLFYYHARGHPFTGVWTFLRDDPSIRIIHAKRRNVLAQYLSLQLAHRTDVWSSRQEPASETPAIRLDPEECRRHFEQVRRYESETAETFRHHPVADVFYEDLAGDRDKALGEVQAFLGLERRPTAPTLVRQRRVLLSRAIENFEELRRTFAATPWSEFFNDRE